MQNLRRLKLSLTALAGGLMFSTAQAHDFYIWPSYFSVNAEKPTDVTVDLSASHTPFRPDFALSSKGLKLYGTDGKEMRSSGFFETARRSTFDVPVESEGTYGIFYNDEPIYFTRYTIGARDTEKFLPGNKSKVKQALPKEAKNVETASYSTLAMSFLTNKAPTDTVLKAKGQGFELEPVTHPADYVTNEPVKARLLFNGQPVKDLKATVELEGAQYQAEPYNLELTSDQDGLVAFTPTHGGRYIFRVNHETSGNDPEADKEVSRIFYAFEVIHE